MAMAGGTNGVRSAALASVTALVRHPNNSSGLYKVRVPHASLPLPFSHVHLSGQVVTLLPCSVAHFWRKPTAQNQGLPLAFSG